MKVAVRVRPFISFCSLVSVSHDICACVNANLGYSLTVGAVMYLRLCLCALSFEVRSGTRIKLKYLPQEMPYCFQLCFGVLDDKTM